MHAKPDDIVPFEMGVILSELKPNAQTYFVKNSSHVIFGWQKQGVLKFLKSDFVQSLEIRIADNV